MGIIRLMIVDDHMLFREGLKALFATTADIQVVGEAEDGETALERIGSLQPDVVLMDIHMPGMGGIQTTRKILEQDPQAGVVMVTMLEDDASVFMAMRAGARGYVLKGANPQEMLETIRAVAQGQALFGPAVASRMVRFFQEAGEVKAEGLRKSEPGNRSVVRNLIEPLSTRENEVLHLIAEGFNNKEIAQRLVLSPNTVRNHITSIFAKLQVADRFQAIRLARGSTSST